MQVAHHDPDAAARVGTFVARQWKLEELHDSGFLCDFYRAATLQGGRALVAVLRRALVSDPALVRAFVEGARRAAQLEHPGVPSVIAEGETADGAPFLLTSWLDGESLARFIERRPGKIPPAEGLRICRDVAEILAAAHAQGVLHGALSPERILIGDDGTVRVQAFGSGAVRALAARALGLSAPPGWPRFEAPEVARGEAPREASDFWSLGAILFAVLTGQGPRAQEGGSTARIRSLSEVAPAATTELTTVVDRLLAADPAARYPSARAIVVALERAAASHEVSGLKTLWSKAPSPLMMLPPPTATAQTQPELPRARFSDVEPPSGLRDVARRDEWSAVPPSIARVARSAPPVAVERAPLVSRPTAPDLLALDGADATSEEAQELADVCALLERAVELRISRGAADPSAVAAITAFHGRVIHALARAPAGVVWNISPWGFVAGDHDVWTPTGTLLELPHRLFEDGVRLIALRPGIGEDQCAGLVAVFTAAATGELAPEDDVVTAIFATGLDHVQCRAVDAFGVVDHRTHSELEAARRETQRSVLEHDADRLPTSWRAARGGRDAAALRWRKRLVDALRPGGLAAEDGESSKVTAWRLDPATAHELQSRFDNERDVADGRFSVVASRAFAVAAERGLGDAVTDALREKLDALARDSPFAAADLILAMDAALVGPRESLRERRRSLASGALASPAVASLVECLADGEPDVRLGRLIALFDTRHLVALRGVVARLPAGSGRETVAEAVFALEAESLRS